MAQEIDNEIRLTRHEIGQPADIAEAVLEGQFEVIRPDRDKVTVVRKSDWMVGRPEFGFSGDAPDYILVVSASGIANGGPATQTLQVAEGCQLIGGKKNIPVGYVGGAGDLPFFADSLTGKIPEQVGTVENRPGSTIPERFKEVEDGITQALLGLADKGIQRIVIVSNGYTGFVPWGVKRGVEAVKARGRNMRVKLVIQDSSYPDIDKPSAKLDKNGYPIDRFHPPAYASDDSVDVYMLINNWLDVNPKWPKNRAPKGTICAATSFPFTPDYMRGWAEWRNVSKIEARRRLSEMVREQVPDMSDLLEGRDTIFVPLFASGGYWDKTNVGKWMTPEQFEDMKKGSELLLDSMRELSERTGRKVLLTGTKRFIQMIGSLQRENVFPAENSAHDAVGVYIAEAPTFKQSDYGLYMKAADAGVFRTTQTNTMAEAILAGVPTITLTMPAHGYMDVEKMDTVWRTQGGRQYLPDVSVGKLTDKIELMVTDAGESASMVELQDRYLFAMHRYPGSNFLSVLSHIAGVPEEG